MTTDPLGQRERSYNPIFEILTDPEAEHGPTVGLIAYGLYKRGKREWVTKYRDNHGGTKPTDGALDQYTEWVTNTILESYINDATQMLAANGQQYLEDTLPGIIEEAIEEERPEIAEQAVNIARPEIIKETLRNSFWQSVLTSALGAFFYTLALIGLLVILRVGGIDILNLANSVNQAVPADHTSQQ